MVGKNKNTITNIFNNLDSLKSSNGEVILPRARKSLEDSSYSTKKNLKKTILDHLQKISQLLEDKGVCFGTISIVLKDKEKASPAEVVFINQTKKEIREEQELQELRICQTKDIIFCSDFNYEFFRNYTKLKMPSRYKVNKLKKELDSKLTKFHQNKFGLYFDAEEQIKWILGYKLNKLNIINNTIRINIRGDKTKCGKSQSFFNACFSLPDEGPIAKTANGQYTLGFYDVVSDNYETMKIALDEIVMSTFKMNGKLKFNGHEYLIDFSLSGDMVWLHIERGLLGPLSNFPCYCCEIERSDLSKNNSETCKSLMRTLAKSEICIKKKN